jgi:hypothetical protein
MDVQARALGAVEAPGMMRRSPALEAACMEVQQWVEARCLFSPGAFALVQIICPVEGFRVSQGQAGLDNVMYVGQAALAQMLEAVKMQNIVGVVEAKLFVAGGVLGKDPMDLFEELTTVDMHWSEAHGESSGELEGVEKLGVVCLVPAEALAEEDKQLAWALRVLCAS